MGKAFEIIFTSWLILLSTYHVLTGLISYFTPSFAVQFYKRFYDSKYVLTDELEVVLKPWGALSIFAGIMGLVAAIDPEKYWPVIAGLVILMLFRIGYRVFYRGKLFNVAGIDPKRNVGNLLIQVFTIILFTLWLHFHIAALELS